MIKYILFDNDGILVDTEQYYFQASREILAEENCTLTPEAFVDISHTAGKGVWEAFPGRFSPAEIDSLRKKRNRRYNELLQQNHLLFPGVTEVVQKLSRNYTMCIVTSALKQDFDTIHSKTDILPFFEFVLANGDYSASKPDPAPYRTAMERFNAQPAECAVVEDTLRGVRSARAAGALTIALPNPMDRGRSNYKQAHFCISSLSELPPLLEKLQ
ncbi:MAG: HAD family hydrolase [Fibrobacterota bacterium]